MSMFRLSGHRNSREDTTPHRGRGLRPRSRRWRVVVVAGAVLVTAGIALGATNWTVGLNAGSKGESQAASVPSLTITATASPSPVNLVYPGAFGDAVVTITNTGKAPVTITAVNLPTSTTYATGYTNSSLTTVNSSCTAAQGTVAWRYATATSGSSHTLTTALIVGASSTLTVTFTNDVTMGTSAPAACASTYFSMPSLTAITATAGAGTPTASPATDAWTA